jgi:photosystem II stability/assembly factor-like uncharacterized protein
VVLLAAAGVALVATVGPSDVPAERALPARLAAESLLLDVSSRDGVMVAVGERGHVLRSIDAGATWTQADVPTRALLTGVHMHDRMRGWAVGHDEVVIRTTDGGVTWQRVHHAPERERPLLDVWFADERQGFAVGAYGTLLATTDCGDTWEARSLVGDDDFHLNHIAAAADGTLYVAAEAGHLYRSEDGGATWQPLTSPYQGSFFGVVPLADGTVLAMGLRGHLYRSPDRGATWQAIPTTSDESLTAALDLGGGRYVVGGMGGTLLWGNGVAVRKQELPSRRAVIALTAQGEGHVLAFGEGGVHRVEIVR